jgi:RNA polymerase primary sigma factor
MCDTSNAAFLRDIEIRRRLEDRPGNHLDIYNHRVLEPEEERRLSLIFLAGELARESIDLRSSRIEQRRLNAAIPQGETAKSQLIIHNLRLVAKEAKRRNVDGMTFDDHFQNGCWGLNRAVEKFDPNRGLKLSTYAIWWIRQAIDRGVANEARLIRLPVHVLDEVRRLAAVRNRLTLQGQSPGIERLAEASNMGIERAEELLQLLLRHVSSLDQVVGDGLTTLGDLLPAEGSGIDRVDAMSDREELDRFLSTLDHREREIIVRRFGFDRGEPETLEGIGEDWGLTRERIRQIESRALSKLRYGMRSTDRAELRRRSLRDIPQAGVEDAAEPARTLRLLLSPRYIRVLDRLAATGGRLELGELLAIADVRNQGFRQRFEQKVNESAASVGFDNPVRISDRVVTLEDRFLNAWRASIPDS